MSLVRFVHAGALRLGSPILGLTDSPDWLKRIAVSAVRQSVIQLFDAAVAAGCQFVYVAGRLTEQAEDLRLASLWLAGQQRRLQSAGVRLVLAGPDAAAAVSAGDLSALAVPRGEYLVVRSAENGLRFSTESSAVVPRGSLCFLAPGSQRQTGAICFDSALHEGPLQTLSAAESGGGGVLCEADLERQELSVRPCGEQVLRFASERLSCPDGTTPEELLSMLHAASRSLAGSRGTTVVEWEIDGRLSSAVSSGARLCEAELLRELRASLRAGHAGAWPARIRFSDRSELSLGAGPEVLSRELAEAVQRRQAGRQEAPSAGTRQAGLPLGAGSEVPETLRILWPAA